MTNRPLGADYSFPVWSPQCHSSRSVVVSSHLYDRRLCLSRVEKTPQHDTYQDLICVLFIVGAATVV